MIFSRSQKNIGRDVLRRKFMKSYTFESVCKERSKESNSRENGKMFQKSVTLRIVHERYRRMVNIEKCSACYVSHCCVEHQKMIGRFIKKKSGGSSSGSSIL